MRRGSLEEALAVLAQVPELDQSRGPDHYSQRLADRNSLVLVAEHDGRLAGFKIGYEVSADEFYSWVGGVIPEFRMRHLAVSMLEAQERWAARNGYNKISVKTESRFPAMLQLLLTCGYRRVGTEEAGGKLLLERTITQK